METRSVYCREIGFHCFTKKKGRAGTGKLCRQRGMSRGDNGYCNFHQAGGFRKMNFTRGSCGKEKGVEERRSVQHCL